MYRRLVLKTLWKFEASEESMIGLLRLVVCAVMTLLALAGTATTQQLEPSDERELVQLVNQERARAGLPAFEVDDRLTLLARRHSELMAEKHSLSHQFGGEPDLRRRIASTSLRFNSSAENVAYDMDAGRAHQGLMNSPHHRENIMSPEYTAIGIGVVRKGDLIYVTQDFAHRLPEISLETAEETIEQSFADMRQSAGAAPLPLRLRPELREMACAMAANDYLDPKIPAQIRGAQTVVVYTATEVGKFPSNMQKLKTVKASGYSLGACFSKSSSYPNAVYWVVVVTYF